MAKKRRRTEEISPGRDREVGVLEHGAVLTHSTSNLPGPERPPRLTQAGAGDTGLRFRLPSGRGAERSDVDQRPRCDANGMEGRR